MVSTARDRHLTDETFVPEDDPGATRRPKRKRAARTASAPAPRPQRARRNVVVRTVFPVLPSPPAPRPATSSRYLTTAEAATELRCSEKTVYRMVKRGELMAMKVGTRIRILASSLPSPDGPRRLPPPRASKYGAPGTCTAAAKEIIAARAAR